MPDLFESADARRGNHPLTPQTIPSTPPLERPTSHESAPVLVFERVSKWYGPVIGVNQVTLELRPGITGLVGHNGAGKSTLMQLAAGQIRPDLGSVQILGREAITAAGKRHVGYCPDLDVFYEDMTGRAFVEAMAGLNGYSSREASRRTEETLQLVGMKDHAHRPLAGYSKGMRQRIKLAQALLHDPALLLLDEPLSGIDPIGRREMIALFHTLAARGKCLLISSHELDELEKLTDHIAILASGRIAAVGTLSRIRDLLDDFPLTIRIRCEPIQVLARALIEWDDVAGLDRDGHGLRVRARNPRQFFERFSALVLEENLDVQHLETLDESTQDVLTYLLGGRGA